MYPSDYEHPNTQSELTCHEHDERFILTGIQLNTKPCYYRLRATASSGWANLTVIVSREKTKHDYENEPVIIFNLCDDPFNEIDMERTPETVLDTVKKFSKEFIDYCNKLTFEDPDEFLCDIYNHFKKMCDTYGVKEERRTIIFTYT